jgi:hypothetical protein
MATLVWLILLFPLVGTLANAVSWKDIGHRAHWIAVSAVGLSFLAPCGGGVNRSYALMR